MSTADWYHFLEKYFAKEKMSEKNPKWDGMVTSESRMRTCALIMTCLYCCHSNSCRFSYANLMLWFILGILMNSFIWQPVKYSLILNNESQTTLQFTGLESVSDKAQQRTPILKACNESSIAELLPRGKLNREQPYQMTKYTFSDKKSFFSFIFSSYSDTLAKMC